MPSRPMWFFPVPEEAELPERIQGLFEKCSKVMTSIVSLPQPVLDGLVAEGYSFSRRGAPSEGIIRIACAFDTTEEAVDALVATAHRYAGQTSEVDRPAVAVR